MAILVALLALCTAVSWITRDAMANLPFLKHHRTAGNQKLIVDLRPWQTAQSLEPLAMTAEEKEFAHDAQRLADHEVDQAFATAMRVAATQKTTLTPEVINLQQRIADLQQAVNDDQKNVQQLTLPTKPGASHSAALKSDKSADDDADNSDSPELALAKAQLDLDTDQLTEAQQDLARSSGDQRARIQQELTAHEATMQQYDAQTHDLGQVAVLSVKHFATFADRISAWFAQRSRYQLLQQALQAAQQDATTLTAERAAYETGDKAAQTPPSDAPSRLAELRAKTARHQLLGIYADRILSEQQLAAVYQKWSAQVLLQHRIVLHLIMQSMALVVVIMICVLLASGLVRHLLSRPKLDPRSAQTLRTVIQIALQFVGALCILIVIFGVPRQMPTILGFATAGLTVALQQFILAFIGWFVLMGKNGIRVGDTVEINGVGGEVLEVNLFRTTLLETGNWTDKGHPTGRRVTFVNNFAVTGQYFNFSTSGQWMWDEVSVTVPSSEDSYLLIERIHKIVLKQTEHDAAIAEREWKTDTHRHSLKQYSASPTVNLRPAGSGTDILVRYVTRAPERFEVRNRIYQSILEVLHTPEQPAK
ncbi:MAG: mechanosensitive ion channel family protein [Acidobacteriaceae bacterium]|jgi:small-conductance mechanosensitive channel|nr:mechanosensitive ion channel family protein [Acidobacteriaceae bacterium]